MTAGLETVAAVEYLYARLTADPVIAAAGVFDAPAPDKTPSPWVQYTHVSGIDVMVVGTARVMQNQLWQVHAVCQGQSFRPAEDLSRRIDAQLHGGPLTAVADGQLLGSLRTDSIRMTRVAGGLQYRWLGGLYRLYVQ